MEESIPSIEGPGTVIGNYRILESIGEGGFGTVYRAEQTVPVQRHVALKIIKLGMDTKQVVARFEAERQAMAMMSHPSIAKVHDAVQMPVHVRGSELTVTASIGTATYPGDAETVERLLARADQAMYTAKAARVVQMVTTAP